MRHQVSQNSYSKPSAWVRQLQLCKAIRLLENGRLNAQTP